MFTSLRDKTVFEKIICAALMYYVSSIHSVVLARVVRSQGEIQRERERERETDRQTDRHRDRQTESNKVTASKKGH